MAHGELNVRSAIEIVERQTAVVIPVYFRADVAEEFAAGLLGDTVHMFVREVADPTTIVLSVDGDGLGVPIAQRVAATYGVRVVHTERNRGKLAALRNGVQAALGRADLRYVALVDQDGDHFANELLNFVRAAEHARHGVGGESVLVLGSRLSRHRPLGFLRAEQEELANRMLMDALAYRAALNGRPLALQFVSAGEEAPDFHSGYKLCSRPAAEAVFLTEPQLAGGEEAYYRHACEAVISVEALQSGAVLATVSRRTYDEQPMSNFANLDRSRLAADMIVWPCRRLGVPGPFVAQWLANHLHKLLLGTLAPQGVEELLTIRAMVLGAYGLAAEGAEFLRARFV